MTLAFSPHATTDPPTTHPPTTVHTSTTVRGRRRLAVVAALLMALLAPMLTHAAPAEAAVRAPTTTESAVAKAVLTLLNQERAMYKLPALTSNSRLQSAARAHSAAMAKADKLSHQLPGERSLGQRITASGYRWSWCAENVGWTTARNAVGARGIETIMFDEHAPFNGHRLNILSTTARSVGIDIYITANKLWFTTDFGRP